MQSVGRVVVIGGGPVAREAARVAVRHGADVTLVADRPNVRDRLDAHAIRFLAREAALATQGWEPEGPSPGSEYAPALRETLLGAVDLAEWNYHNQMADLRTIGVQVVEGRGSVVASSEVRAELSDGRSCEVTCSSIVLATGAGSPLEADLPRVLTPASMCLLEKVPESMIIVGSSPSAIDLASFITSYGVSVTVVGAVRPALYFLDEELQERVQEQYLQNLLRVITGETVVTGTADGRVDLLLSDNSHIDADYVLPFDEGRYGTDNLGLEGPGVRLGPDGEILVDERMQTSVPGIFAAGAVTGSHNPSVALKQAEIAAENACGGEKKINYRIIPDATWADPQASAVGLPPEEDEQLRGLVTTSVICMGTVPGSERLVKVTADEASGRLLRLQALGDGAVEAIHMGALAMSAGANLTDIADLTCAGGTMTQCMVEAAVRGQPPAMEETRPLIVDLE